MRSPVVHGEATAAARPRAVVEEAARRYDRCDPDDSFADLMHRAAFSKEDRRLMEDWLAAVGHGRNGRGG